MKRFLTHVTDLLSVSPLLVAAIVGVLLSVVEFGLFMKLPLVVLVLIYVFWIVPNFFLEIVEFKALGHAGWPVLSIETLVGARNQVGIVFGVLVLVAGAGYVALRYFGVNAPAQLGLGAGLVLLPGSVALLAVTREFSVALNPLKILAAAAGMGVTYLYCLGGGAVILFLLSRAQEQGGLHWYFLLVYALFLQAFLIGSSVYVRRDVLGVHAPRSPEVLAARAQAETVAIRRRILSHAYGLAAHGNRAGALKHVEGYLAADEDTLEARLFMLNEMARWEDGGAALEFGARLIDYCERHGFTAEGVRVRSIRDHLTARRPTGPGR